MIIKIFDRETAEKVCTEFQDAYWISVNDVGYPLARLSVPKKLYLTFDDVTPYGIEYSIIHPFYKEQFEHRAPVLFNTFMAKQICEFILSVKDDFATVCIHCYAGKSRSVAIGAALNTVINAVHSPVLSHFRLFVKEYCCNTGLNFHVYNVLMNTLIDTIK